jgi:transcriptional regulator of met regulon
MKMKNAKNDVWLANGNGYMVENKEYREHLKKSDEVKEVSAVSFFLFILVVILTFSVRNQNAPIIGQSTKPTPIDTTLNQLE